MAERPTPDVLLVSASSNIQSVAGAIAYGLSEQPEVRLRAVGAGAVNQAAKALAVARGYVAPKGQDLYVKIGFVSVEPLHDKGSGAITSLEFVAVSR